MNRKETLKYTLKQSDITLDNFISLQDLWLLTLLKNKPNLLLANKLK